MGEAQLAPAGNRLANTVQSGRVSGQPAARRQPRMTPAVGSDQQQQQQPQLWPHQQEQTQRHRQPDATGLSIQQALQPESEPVVRAAARCTAPSEQEAISHEQEQQGYRQQPQQQQHPVQQQRRRQSAQHAEQPRQEQQATSELPASLQRSHLAGQAPTTSAPASFQEPLTPVVCTAAPLASSPQQLAWQAQQAALERHADLAQPPMAGRSKHAQQAEHEAKGPQQPAEQPQWLMGIASAVVQSAPPIAALLQPAELLQSPHTPASAAAAEPLHEHLPSPSERPMPGPTGTETVVPLSPGALPAVSW